MIDHINVTNSMLDYFGLHDSERLKIYVFDLVTFDDMTVLAFCVRNTSP